MPIPATLRMAAQPVAVGPLALYPWDAAIAARFVVKSKFEDQPPMQLWSRVTLPGAGEFIGLPWHCCPSPSQGTDARTRGRPVSLSFNIGLRPAQVAPVAKMEELLLAGRSFVMKAPTGSGKTIMSLKAIARLGISTLVVVPKDDLMDQWVERIEFACGLKKSQIGRVQGDICDYKGKEIVLGSLRSVHKQGRYPKDFYREFGLLVGDEVHRWGAEQMALISHQFFAAQRLGLTATFHRQDGRDLMVEAHVGQIEVEAKIDILKPKVFRFKSNWKCPTNRLGQQIPHQPGRVATILHSVFANSHRNRMICHFARSSYQKGRRIVIFSDHLEHLDTLCMMLPAWGVPKDAIGHYYGSTTKQQLQIAGSKSVILATYPKMAEGTDIPELDTLILAGPRSNIEQTVGRILRECSTKQPPVVFDICDNDSPVLAGYAKSRLNVYRKLGAEVIDAHVPEEELKHAS